MDECHVSVLKNVKIKQETPGNTEQMDLLCVTPTTFLEKRIGSCIANTAFKFLDSWTSIYQVHGTEVYLPKTWLHINTWSHIKRSLKNGDPQ